MLRLLAYLVLALFVYQATGWVVDGNFVMLLIVALSLLVVAVLSIKRN